MWELAAGFPEQHKLTVVQVKQRNEHALSWAKRQRVCGPPQCQALFSELHQQVDGRLAHAEHVLEAFRREAACLDKETHRPEGGIQPQGMEALGLRCRLPELRGEGVFVSDRSKRPDHDAPGPRPPLLLKEHLH